MMTMVAMNNKHNLCKITATHQPIRNIIITRRLYITVSCLLLLSDSLVEICNRRSKEQTRKWTVIIFVVRVSWIHFFSLSLYRRLRERGVGGRGREGGRERRMGKREGGWERGR